MLIIDSALFVCVEGLSSEVVEREGEQTKHKDADPVLVEWVVFTETRERSVGSGLVESDGDAEKADDAASGDEA